MSETGVIPPLGMLFHSIRAKGVDKQLQAMMEADYPKGKAPNVMAENAFCRWRARLALRKPMHKPPTARANEGAGESTFGQQRLKDIMERFSRAPSPSAAPVTRTPRTAARGIRSTTRRAGNKAVASSSGDPDSEGEPPPAASLCPLCTAIQRARSLACLVAAHPQHPTTDRFTPSQPAAKSAAGLLSFPQFTQGSFSL